MKTVHIEKAKGGYIIVSGVGKALGIREWHDKRKPGKLLFLNEGMARAEAARLGYNVAKGKP